MVLRPDQAAAWIALRHCASSTSFKQVSMHVPLAQVVRGAPKDGDEVEGLFDRARQAGARQGTAADLPGGNRGASSNGTAFTGVQMRYVFAMYSCVR